MTEKPIEDRSDIDKELHTDLSIVKNIEGLFLLSVQQESTLLGKQAKCSVVSECCCKDITLG